MIDYKQSTQIRVPVRLLTANGVPVAGVLFSAITVSIEKADGTASAFVPTSPQWEEKTFGAFLGQGKYDLIVPSTFTDQLGPFCVAVATTGANAFIGAFKIIAYESQDIYNNTSSGSSGLGGQITAFQTDFDTWKTDWTTTRAGRLDNLTVNLNTLATASALSSVSSSISTVNTTVNTINSTTSSSATSITTILKINTGKWGFNTTGGDANKFVIYDPADNTTPLFKFFLLGQDGITSNFITPYFRVPTT